MSKQLCHYAYVDNTYGVPLAGCKSYEEKMGHRKIADEPCDVSDWAKCVLNPHSIQATYRQGGKYRGQSH